MWIVIQSFLIMAKMLKLVNCSWWLVFLPIWICTLMHIALLGGLYIINKLKKD